MEKRIYYLSNTVISNTKREKDLQVFNVFTQVGVKQLSDFLRTVTAASDLVDCTLVNCVNLSSEIFGSNERAFRCRRCIPFWGKRWKRLLSPSDGN